MSESKHTPGPWDWDAPTERITAAEYDIAELWCGPPEWEANARLVAAAPDLLDSAKAFDALHLVIAEAIRRYDPQDIGLQTRILAALKANREAIQKAETHDRSN